MGKQSQPTEDRTTTYSLLHGNLKRKYIVHLPPSYTGKNPVPAVLNFHGGGGTAESQVEISDMNQKSDQAGFIVVYPNGVGQFGDKLATWNAGDHCCGTAFEKKVDDVDFTRAIIKDLDKRFQIDRSRIYATGFSNGAIFSYRLACELSDQIAAVASVAGHLDLAVCKPERAVPILDIKNKLDQCIRDAGTCGGCLGSKTWPCPTAEQGFQDLASLYQCLPESTEHRVADNAVLRIHEGCRDNAEVRMLTVENAGHQWPGGGKALKEEKVGPFVSSPEANDIIWDFFKRYSLRGKQG